MLENPPSRADRAASRRDEPEEAAAPVPASPKALAKAQSAPLPPSRPFDLGAASHGRTKQAAN
jgi:rare lipoprotein A